MIQMQGSADLSFDYNILETLHKHNYIYGNPKHRAATVQKPNPWNSVLRIAHIMSHLLSIEDGR